ncbi:adenylyltransferase/cytidyltransferase family protein [Candidatus Woesearchaeota archaeon]|nr:adenylyltransferase/cytidyltransferase family protein [Candidatus Woesearchaeota archaeon]
MKALVIGRFQPVHKGHIALIEDVDALKLEKIILGIGEEGKNRTPKNPFYFDEIRAMWLPNLEKLITPVEMYKIPDINNNEDYANYVEKITGCNEEDTIIVSGNAHTLGCFTNYGKNYRAYMPQRSDNGDGRLCGTKIRERVKAGGPWQTYVPESTMAVIEKINGADIIKYTGGENAN